MSKIIDLAIERYRKSSGLTNEIGSYDSKITIHERKLAEVIDLTMERYHEYTELNKKIKRNRSRLTRYDKAKIILETCLKDEVPKEEVSHIKKMIGLLGYFISRGEEEELALKIRRRTLENTLKNLVNGYITEENK